MSKVKWAVWGSCGIAKRRTIPEGLVPGPQFSLDVSRCPAQAHSRDQVGASLVCEYEEIAKDGG